MRRRVLWRRNPSRFLSKGIRQRSSAEPCRDDKRDEIATSSDPTASNPAGFRDAYGV